MEPQITLGSRMGSRDLCAPSRLNEQLRTVDQHLHSRRECRRELEDFESSLVGARENDPRDARLGALRER